MIAAHLKSTGVHVPRSRLRASIHHVDPHAHDRLRPAIHRRVYSVDSPNSVWHIDGNHKMIRWRIVVHGGIDGYSRMIVFLRCSTDNRATTVLSAFERGVEQYGLPNKVRSDCGGENVDVWRYMLEQHNNDTSHIIVGSSAHNEHIERLWRDVHQCVLKLFADKFRRLEQSGLLDPINEVDIFCLHMCYLPRINQCINSFEEAWNNHCVSTEGNATPYQLFVAGLLSVGQIPDVPSVPSTTASTLPTIGEHVQVPRSRFSPCTTLQQQIHLRFNPLQSLDYFEDGLYVSVVSFVGQHLSLPCPYCCQH